MLILAKKLSSKHVIEDPLSLSPHFRVGRDRPSPANKK
jgi:hypothetical protein